MNVLKFSLLNLIALAAAVVLWPYALSGVLASAFCAMKFRRWVSSAAALSLVSLWRFRTGAWIVKIGDSAPDRWYFELLPGIASWALAYLFVSAFALWPGKFQEGFRSRFGIRSQDVALLD